MPQLDGLRAFAFLMVALSHWIPDMFQFGIPLGTGVQLFFVLSGFLITGILLRNRSEESHEKTSTVLRAFYVRRSLRIFPLYYLVLTLSVLFNVGPIRETWLWHFSYLSNFYFAFNPHAGEIAEPYLHLWSLGVEEQFYLLWPLIALTTPRRRLHALIWCGIVGALLFRIGSGLYWGNPATARYLTPSNFDALGIGALVAYALHYRGLEGLRRAKVLCAVVGMLGLAITVPSSAWAGSQLMHWMGHTFLVVFYGAVVAQAAEGFRGVAGTILDAAPMRYLGRISYGLYVYHYFAPLAWLTLLTSIGIESTVWKTWPYNLMPYFGLSVIAAVLSWHGYEAWFLRLKRRFEYRGARAVA